MSFLENAAAIALGVYIGGMALWYSLADKIAFIVDKLAGNK